MFKTLTRLKLAKAINKMPDELHRAFYNLMVSVVVFHYITVLIPQLIFLLALGYSVLSEDTPQNNIVPLDLNDRSAMLSNNVFLKP